MGGAVDAVSDVVGGAVDTVGNAVEDVGDFVVDKVVEPVATAVDNTIQAAIDDPVNTAIRVAALAYGGPAGLAAANAAIAVADGQSLEDAALTAGKTYAIAQAGQMAGAEAGSAAADAGASAEAAQVASGATSGATQAGLRGGDMEQGAIMGGLNAGTSIAAKSLSDQQFEDWSQQQAEKAYENAPSPTEQDVLAADPSIEMNFPLSTPTDATGPGYYDETTGEYIKSDIGGLQAPLDNTSGTVEMDGYTYDPDTKTWTTPEGETYNMDYLKNSGEAVSGSDLLKPPSDNAPEGYDPALTTKEIKAGLDFVKNAVLAGDQQKTRLAGIKKNASQMCAAMGGFDASVPWLSTKEQMLYNKLPVGCASTESKGASPSELDNIYKSITPELAKEFQDRGIGRTAHMVAENTPSITGLGGVMGFAAGGCASACKTDAFCSTWGAMGKYVPKFYPTSSGMLQAGGKKQGPALMQLKQMQSHIANSGNMGGMAKGGLPAKYEQAAPEGHNPEFITGLTGYYACGGGTGQSDDITAMLHDGDYVMDAETVSALGDGSSKAGRRVLEEMQAKIPHRDGATGKPVPAKIADGEYVFPASFVSALGGGDNKKGADILDGLRERLRAHKRSAPNSKIPPKAKSPLDYIKGSKG